jgi:hypothetical protein
MAAGIAIVCLFVLVVWMFRTDPAQQLAFKATRVDLVGQMQAGLASASEAEMSAVLAITDEDSRAFADQARAATAAVARDREALGKLLSAGGTQRERDLLDRFSPAFLSLQRIDDEVLRLAVKNTNRKAHALLFGPATEALTELDGALARVIAKRADAPDAKQVMLLAFGSRVGLLRIHTLMAPHIPEESEEKMDRLEASMTKEEIQVRADLDRLARLRSLAKDPDLALASSSFARYGELKARMLALSRENTNVRSLVLSLGERRNAMNQCVDALATLKQEILDEPVAGVSSYRREPTR